MKKIMLIALLLVYFYNIHAYCEDSIPKKQTNFSSFALTFGYFNQDYSSLNSGLADNGYPRILGNNCNLGLRYTFNFYSLVWALDRRSWLLDILEKCYLSAFFNTNCFIYDHKENPSPSNLASTKTSELDYYHFGYELGYKMPVFDFMYLNLSLGTSFMNNYLYLEYFGDNVHDVKDFETDNIKNIELLQNSKISYLGLGITFFRGTKLKTKEQIETRGLGLGINFKYTLNKNALDGNFRDRAGLLLYDLMPVEANNVFSIELLLSYDNITEYFK